MMTENFGVAAIRVSGAGSQKGSLKAEPDNSISFLLNRPWAAVHQVKRQLNDRPQNTVNLMSP